MTKESCLPHRSSDGQHRDSHSHSLYLCVCVSLCVFALSRSREERTLALSVWALAPPPEIRSTLRPFCCESDIALSAAKLRMNTTATSADGTRRRRRSHRGAAWSMVEPTDSQSSMGGFVNMVGVTAGSKQRKNRKKKNVVFGAGGLAPVRRHAGDAEPPSDSLPLRDDGMPPVDDDYDHARPKAPTTVSPTMHRRKKPQQVLAKEDDDDPLPSSSSCGSQRANEARQQAQHSARRGRKKNNYQHRAPQQHKQRQATANPSRRVSPSAAESSGDEASRVPRVEAPFVPNVLHATAPDPSLDSSSATSSCEIRPEEDDDDLILARHLEYIYEATDHLLRQHAALAAPNVASPLLCATQPQTCRVSSRYPHYDATKVGLPCAVAQSTELRAGRCTKL